MRTERGVASLHAGLIQRARRFDGREASAGGAGAVSIAPPKPAAGGHETGWMPKPVPTLRAVTAEPEPAPQPVPRRRALTVRVEPELHARLKAAKTAAGETTQRVLYDALCRELQALEARIARTR